MLKHFSDERQSDRENPPRPFGLRRKSGAPSDRSSSQGWESGHTSLSVSAVGSPQPSASASSSPIFARNAVRPNSVNRP
jgi:hypothetical protein